MEKSTKLYFSTFQHDHKSLKKIGQRPRRGHNSILTVANKPMVPSTSQEKSVRHYPTTQRRAGSATEPNSASSSEGQTKAKRMQSIRENMQDRA